MRQPRASSQGQQIAALRIQIDIIDILIQVLIFKTKALTVDLLTTMPPNREHNETRIERCF